MGIRINQDAPDFTADAVINSGEFTKVTLSDYAKAGKWTVLYFYPLDFTFVCPTEIREFNEWTPKFADAGAQVVGCSIDSKFSHQAWLASGTLTTDKSIKHPIVADINKTIGRDYGVLAEAAGISMRGTVIIDPKGKIRYYQCSDAPVGRNVEETFRLLQALQHADSNPGEVCPVNWKPGAETIKVG